MRNQGRSLAIQNIVRRSVCFFNDTATTEIYTLSLHDALPICVLALFAVLVCFLYLKVRGGFYPRSEEHTSELQSPCNLVCRLLLVKKQFVVLNHGIAQPFVARFVERSAARFLVRTVESDFQKVADWNGLVFFF